MKKIGLLAIIILLIANISFSQDSLKSITLSDIYKNYVFRTKPVRGITSLPNGKQYTMIVNGSLVVYDYKTGDSVSTLINANDLKIEGQDKPIRLSTYEMSSDESKFLIPTETESIYRHSSKSVFYIYDKKNNSLSPLSNDKQRLADFSPDGQQVAFVRDNNIYLKNLATANEVQITSDGKVNHIINGTCDWVYEEEFGFTKAFFWSPDGKKIAFYRFDESRVKEFTLTYYGDLYPELYTYKYPKAGEENSLVDIYVYNLETGKTTKMEIGSVTDQYIPRIKWSNNPNLLAIQRLNRLQNHLDILLANGETGASTIMYSEGNPYYIDITDNLTFMNDNSGFLFTSEADGFNHIYLYNIDGKLETQLTKGNWDVTEVYGFDAKKKLVYYQSAETSAINRDIYSVDLKGKIKKLSTREGENEADFSDDFSFYINTWSDANTPPYITLNQADGKEVRVLENNAALVARLKEYKMSKKEFFTFTTPETTLPDGKQVELNAWRILPYDFDSTKKYPVLLVVYGGPGSQEVMNNWASTDINFFWCEMLADNGFLIVSVDPRGTDARGQEFKKMTYMELGKYETIDFAETAKYLSSLNFVDPQRIGIIGWSYGGYMALNAITQDADYFNTAIAVAPVTNWRYYDNIYTERFMRTPQENPDGYDKNSPIFHVDKLKGNLLLVHGGADDNVHPQNTMDMVTAFVEANKQFDLFIYPNKNHGISGGNTRYHLYKKMTDFLDLHLLEEK